MRVVGAIAALFGVAAVVLLFSVVNGGYVYRVECPRAGGGTETEWTYRWQSVLPYIGYSRSGCETHSATRVGLDAIGVWKIGDDGDDGVADHPSEYPAGLVTSMVDGCVAEGESRSFCECAVNELTLRLSPSEASQFGAAIGTGAQTFEDLPESIRGKVRDASVAADTDCRS